ncbi:MAG: hypothetical protein FJ087_09735 [Deltaproteobacteria bacterium]|nr:hypothetical protein [Deltaproteobacteria bacterium]
MMRAAILLGAIVSVLAATGCQSQAERLHAETLFHMENAIKLLEQTPANTEAAVANLDKYLTDNRLRLAETRAAAQALMAKMPADEREAFARRALDRSRPLRERAETLARTYPDPPRIMLKLQQFL